VGLGLGLDVVHRNTELRVRSRTWMYDDDNITIDINMLLHGKKDKQLLPCLASETIRYHAVLFLGCSHVLV